MGSNEAEYYVKVVNERLFRHIVSTNYGFILLRINPMNNLFDLLPYINLLNVSLYCWTYESIHKKRVNCRGLKITDLTQNYLINQSLKTFHKNI